MRSKQLNVSKIAISDMHMSQVRGLSNLAYEKLNVLLAGLVVTFRSSKDPIHKFEVLQRIKELEMIIDYKYKKEVVKRAVANHISYPTHKKSKKHYEYVTLHLKQHGL